MEYDLELEKVKGIIKDKQPDLVCIQLPEGLKPKALEISDYIESETDSRVLIWSGTCFGACDTPDLTGLGVDLLVQWGHSEWQS